MSTRKGGSYVSPAFGFGKATAAWPLLPVSSCRCGCQSLELLNPAKMTPVSPALSLIIPFFNEEPGVLAFLKELGDTVDELSAGAHDCPALSCEVLLIDDGSSDHTGHLLAEACRHRPGWQAITLARNFGQAAALYAGINLARGRCLVLLDGDGQNDPADIPRLLSALDAGADLAVGVRARRRDHWQRRWMSRVANAVRRRVLRDGVRDTGCGLKAMQREVIDSLIPIRTLYSFIPALAVAAGFRVAEVVVNHRPRRGGESKYGLRNFWYWPLLDMIGVWWFSHRRCPTNGLVQAPINLVVLPAVPSTPARVKA